MRADPASMVPAEHLPDDVQRELGGESNIQVELYPGHQLVAFRFRRKLSIRMELLVVPLSFIDMVFLSRLQAQVAQALSQNGGTVVPANGPTPAPLPGTVQ